jgi:hypothetical protein
VSDRAIVVDSLCAARSSNLRTIPVKGWPLLGAALLLQGLLRVPWLSMGMVDDQA